MVWINNQCSNYSVPKGTMGGAMCICKKCREARGEFISDRLEKHQPQLAHIYSSKWHCNGGPKIKILCTGEWTKAEYEPGPSHSSKGYHIGGVHQCSIGAGHNATCPYCLIEYAKRKTKTDNIIMNKLIKLAEEKQK